MNNFYVKLPLLILIIFTVLTPSAFAQYDFTGDGIDEILSVTTEEDGLIRWNIIDTTNFETYFVGGFGSVSSQLAPGNWLSKTRTNIAVMVHGNPLNTIEEDNRFRLRMPVNISESKEIVISELQRGKKASVISNADFDGNAYSDVVIIRRGHRSRAIWYLNLNPLNMYSAKRRRKRFGDGRDIPISFRFRGNRDSLASIVIPRGRRALKIKHCLIPCIRKRRIRIKNNYIDSKNIIPQILKGERDKLLFTRQDLSFEKTLNLINLRGKLIAKTLTSKDSKAVTGNFYDANLLIVNNGEAKLKNLETHDEYTLPFKVGKLVANQIIEDYPKSEQDLQNSNIPVVTSTPTVTITPTIITSTTKTPIINKTSIPVLTITPSLSYTFSLTPYTPTLSYTPTAKITTTSTATNTFSPTKTITSTYTSTSTTTYTSTHTNTRTPTKTTTNTVTYTSTTTNTPTLTPTQSFTNTPTLTPSLTVTYTATNSPTFTPTETNTPTFTNTATQTPTQTATYTPTFSPTQTSTPYPNLPADISGLVTWYDAADSSTLFTDTNCLNSASDGDLINCWANKASGMPNQIAVSPAIYRASEPEIGNHQTLEFTEDCYSGGDNDLGLDTYFTIFVAIQPNNVGKWMRVMGKGGHDNGGSLPGWMLIFLRPTDQGLNLVATREHSGNNNLIYSPINFSNSKLSIITYTVGIDSIHLSINGTPIATASYNNNPIDSNNLPFAIGCTYNGSNFQNSLHGNYSEAIIYNRELTAQEVHDLEVYLIDKWGVN